MNVVKEHPADTSHLASVFEHEIFIAPLLEPRVEARVVAIAGLLDRAVEVDRILGKWVAGCQVRAAAKPRGIAFFEIPKIRMDSGNHWTARMKDERNTGRKKRGAAAQRNL